MRDAPNRLTRAFWRALGSWFEPRYWFGSPGVVNPPCDLRGYLEGDAGAALTLPAVVRAVSCYSDSIASLPRAVRRRRPDSGMETDTTSDASHLLAAVSYFDLEAIVASSITSGNGYATIDRNERGGASEIAWVASSRVQPGLDERRRLFYRITRDDSLGELEERTLPASDVLHVRFRATGATSRFVGVSPLTLCAPSIAMALRAQSLQAEIYRNVSAPSTYLKAPHKISKELAERLRTDWAQNFGGETGRRGSTAVLGEGLEVGTVSISTAVDAQLNDQFLFSVSEIARALGVPLGLLMQSGSLTHGTAVEELRAFASISLGPYARRFADELTAKLLTDTQRDAGWSVEFDLSSMLTAPNELPDRMSKLVNGGIISVNESREQMGLPDVDDGDELRVPVNTSPWDRWLDGTTGAQQLAHPDTPANPQEASAPRPTLRAVD